MLTTLTRSATRSTIGRSLTTTASTCSGHNRWSKIHRAKAVEDKKKSMRFSKVVTEIIAAAQKGGSDPATNYPLSVALRNARSLDVPKDNIAAALSKASGPQQAEEALVANTYQALGPGQFPLIIETLSDNPTRTAKNVKIILKDRGGQSASVAYAFRKIGRIMVRPREGATFDQIFEDAVEAGAEDVQGEVDSEQPQNTEIEITTDPTSLNDISLKLASPPSEHAVLESGLAYVAADPDSPLPELSDEDEQQLEKLCGYLAEDPDVIAIWTLSGQYEA